MIAEYVTREALFTIEVVLAIIGTMQTLAVTIIAGLFARDSKKRKKVIDDQTAALARAEVRASLRAEESLLSMELQKCGVELSKATAIAIRDKRINGNMEATLKDAEVALKKYMSFVNGVGVKEITKGE